MKKVWSFCKLPLIVATIASILYIIDSFLGKALVAGGSFMWVAFVSWTLFSGATIPDRIKALIGNVIGYMFGVLMFQGGGFFGGNVLGVSLAGLLFVFIANGAMMFFANAKKLWMDSIPAIFMGVFLCFSGLGVKLYPSSFESGALQLSIILIYSTLGLVCGYLTNFFNNLSRKPKLQSIDGGK